jgi:hypothetical protein
LFDPVIAAAIAVWFIVSTGREVFASSEELMWPEKIVCGHSEGGEARTPEVIEFAAGQRGRERKNAATPACHNAQRHPP